jgi:hypothetical protein
VEEVPALGIGGHGGGGIGSARRTWRWPWRRGTGRGIVSDGRRVTAAVVETGFVLVSLQSLLVAMEKGSAAAAFSCPGCPAVAVWRRGLPSAWPDVVAREANDNE